MTTLRMILGVLVLATAVSMLAADDTKQIVSSSAFIVKIEPILSKQSTDVLAKIKAVAVTDPSDKSKDDVEKWEKSLRAELAKQLEEKDKEVLKDLLIDDTFTRLSQAVVQQRTNLDLLLTRLFVARSPDLISSKKEERKAALEKARNEIADQDLAKGLDERKSALIRAASESAAPLIQTALDIRRAEGEKAFLDQFAKVTGLSKIVRCLVTGADTASPTLTCRPEGLLLGGMSIAHVRISGLPVNRGVTVRAQLTEPGQQVGCSSPRDEKCDWVTFETLGSQATGSRDATILVHTARCFGPSYRHRGEKLETAMGRLRPGSKNRELQLVANGVGSELGLDVTFEGNSPIKKSQAIPIAYERWRFETGTMFAVSSIVDNRLVTKTDSNGKIDVVDERAVDTIRPATVLYLNLVPANYEIVAIGFGLHASSDRNVAYYLGGSIRLLSLGDRALASFSAGLNGAQARRFPGLDFKKGSPVKTLEPNDPVLQGSLLYRTGWYVGLSLGFRFGSLGSNTEPGNQ